MNRQLFSLLAIFIASAHLYKANHSVKDTTEKNGICLERYTEQTINATQEYAQNHLDCQDHRTIRHVYYTREKETEREQIENGAAQICNHLQICNKYEAHEDFYNCHNGKSADNIETLITIHLNASAAVIALSSQHEEIEKDVMLCLIEAKRAYAKETRNFLSELKICLKE